MSSVDLKNKTILVTGAAGFIGANLSQRLLEDIKDLLDWCVNNKGILREMGKSGRREALKYTWETYGVKLNEFIDKIYGEI